VKVGTLVAKILAAAKDARRILTEEEVQALIEAECVVQKK